ncbi:MAG: hypothetical protein KIT76_09550 [Pseudolabrys sp.]|nr:hypothetical protein [Pseudolabrys sp.]
MTRTVLAALVFTSFAFSAASAQEFSAQQRVACKGDYDQFCKGTMPGGGRVLACLSKNNDKLSAACKKVVADAKK